MSFCVIGNPESRRIQLFQSALENLHHPPAQVISYLDYFNHSAPIPEKNSWVKIESPGRNFEVEQHLLRLGSELAQKEGSPWISSKNVGQLTEDKGRIRYPRQWYLGFCRLLEQFTAEMPKCRWVNHPADIALMFDKGQCHTHLDQNQVLVPPTLGSVLSFEELAEKMHHAPMKRVFVKLAHGSSASGVVALETNGRQWLATTSVELVQAGSEVCLYNSRRIRRYSSLTDIATIIDTLCRERVHVEAWIPKLGWENHRVDLRVLVITQKARHTVVRMSQTPMTNLHLLNQRQAPDGLRSHMGENAWIHAMQICERAAAAFPRSLYVGVDLVIPPGFRHPQVVEVNAFGDLLPGCLDAGVDAYTAEILALVEDPIPC